jgi:phospholipid-binding lipoprotein MlaA
MRLASGCRFLVYALATAAGPLPALLPSPAFASFSYEASATGAPVPITGSVPTPSDALSVSVPSGPAPVTSGVPRGPVGVVPTFGDQRSHAAGSEPGPIVISAPSPSSPQVLSPRTSAEPADAVPVQMAANTETSSATASSTPRETLSGGPVQYQSAPSAAPSPATIPAKAPKSANDDPLEAINRPIFEVNDFLDRLLFRPIAELDRAIVPPPVRTGVSDVLGNMREPVIFANNLLQGEFSAAGITAERFLINTTLGVGGVFDWANDWDLPKQHGDFGQTMNVWGAGSGPYLVLPFFGPSNVRDAAGLGVEALVSPWQYAASAGGSSVHDKFQIAYFSASAVDKREHSIEAVDALRTGSLDYYAEMRSAYNQHRNSELGVHQLDAVAE